MENGTTELKQQLKNSIIRLKNEMSTTVEELKRTTVKYTDEGRKRVRIIFSNTVDELERFNDELENIEDEVERLNVNEVENEARKVINSSRKVYVCSDGKKKEISNELVMNHQESLLNVNMIDIDSRSDKNEIEIDFQFKYLDEILKYMNKEYDIWVLNGVEFVEFCKELIEMNISFRMDILNRLCTDSNGYGVGWKNRCLNVNNNTYYRIFNHIKELKLGQLAYNNEQDQIELVQNTLLPSAIEILNDFENYLKAPSRYIKNDNLKVEDIISLFNEIDIGISTALVKSYLLNYTCSFFCYGSKILENTDYDDKLREWCGDYHWTLIYRASEHEYSSKSFHKYCDDKGQTLIIIKSSGGWIFGGYTTQSWNEWSIYCLSISLLVNR